MKIEIGVLRIARRDPGQGRLWIWLEDRVIPAFSKRVLPIDAFIAGTVLVHDMSVVTWNVRGFEATEVALLDPWA